MAASSREAKSKLFQYFLISSILFSNLIQTQDTTAEPNVEDTQVSSKHLTTHVSEQDTQNTQDNAQADTTASSLIYDADTTTDTNTTEPTEPPYYIALCPSDAKCYKLGGECIQCKECSSPTCVYGTTVNKTCWPKEEIVCTGPQNFTREVQCRYCYQVDPALHTCTHSTSCRSVAAPREYYVANCTVPDNVLCLGNRRFHKRMLCNWTSGYRWSTALALSVTLGGFGIDRFYLGLWKEGIGKFFSFGGLGVWTLVDVVLIATGYVGPADGSLYIF